MWIVPPFLVHRKFFRFSLTPTFLRNRIISKFRHLRRDSRSVVHGPFLEQLSSASSAKRAVRPRLLFSAPAGPNLLSDPTDCAPKTAAVPRHNTRSSTTRFMRGPFLLFSKRRTLNV